MMRRGSHGWLFAALMIAGLAGCGGGNAIEEGPPPDMATASKQAEEEFRRTWAQVLHLHDAERRRGAP